MNKTCGWYITAPENHTVKLQLTSRLGSLDTSKDKLEVYDVEGSELSLIAPSQKIYSKSRFVYVVFKSDYKVDPYWKSGIFVKYTAVRTGKSREVEGQRKNKTGI